MSFSSTSVTLLFLTLAVISSPARGADRVCRIKTMVGSVKIRRGQSPKWLDARPRMPLKERDAVRTFVESEVELELDDGSVITMSENSSLELSTLKQLEGKQQATGVRILNGDVISNVKKLVGTKSSFEFETPTATASIRGTRVGFNVTGRQTNIRVYEGKVYVVPRGGTEGVEVGENQMTSVKKGQKTVKIEALAEPEEKAGADSAAADSAAVDSSAADSSAVDSAGADTSSAGPDTDSARVDTSGDRGQDTADVEDGLGEADTGAVGALKLVLGSPAEGESVSPGATIQATGTVSPAGADVTVDGNAASVSGDGSFRATIAAPDQAGPFDVTVEATSGSDARSITRSLVVEARSGGVKLTIQSPADGREVKNNMVAVSGVTSPGAEVSCGGVPFTVGPDGTFRGEVPLPDEDGEYELEFQAVLGSEEANVIRTVSYKQDVEKLRLSVFAPHEGREVTATSIQFRGEVAPFNAEVLCNGRGVSVSGSGSFTGMTTIPAEEGEHELEFEAMAGDESKRLVRTVSYKKPPDTFNPLLQPSSLPRFSAQQVLWFTVVDRTDDEEITFYREIDGSTDSETGRANSRFQLELEEGVHEYAVWAEDREGNRSARPSGKIAYLPRTVSIRMVDPPGEKFLRLPPSAPQSTFEPEYTVEFYIDDLPDDSPETLAELIKEVRVVNAATGRAETRTKLLDVDQEFDVELKRSTTNRIEIRVTDVNNRVVTRSVNIHVQ